MAEITPMTEQQIYAALTDAFDKGDKPPLKLIARGLWNLERIADAQSRIAQVLEDDAAHGKPQALFDAKAERDSDHG